MWSTNPFKQIQKIHPTLTELEWIEFCNPQKDNEGEICLDWKHPILRAPTDEEILNARDATQAEIDLEKNEGNRKVWDDASAFLDEFTDTELTSLNNSSHVSGLAIRLAAWKGAVWSNDPRIIEGMKDLVAVGILTQERHDKILGL